MDEQLRLLEEQFNAGYISEALYNSRRNALMAQGLSVPYNTDYSIPLEYQPTLSTDLFSLPSSNNNAEQVQPLSYSNTGIVSQQLQPYTNPTINNVNSPITPLTGALTSPELRQAYIDTPINPSSTDTQESLRTDFIQQAMGKGLTQSQAEDEFRRRHGDTSSFNNLFNQSLPFFNPYGTNLESDFYALGNFLGTERGTTGRGMGIASSAIASGLGSARTLLSGLANSRATNRAILQTREQMARRNYTAETQYPNYNYLGGTL